MFLGVFYLSVLIRGGRPTPHFSRGVGFQNSVKTVMIIVSVKFGLVITFVAHINFLTLLGSSLEITRSVATFAGIEGSAGDVYIDEGSVVAIGMNILPPDN